MGKGSGPARRARAKVVVAGAVVAVVLGIAAPAFAALLGLNLSLPISLPGQAPTSTTSTIKVSVPDLLGITDLPGGLNQTTTALNQLLSGLKNGVSVAAPVVQAHATDAAAAAIADLQSRAQATAAAALAFDPQGAADEALAIATDLQSQATGEVAGLLPLALTTGLQVVQNIVTPVCGLTAIPSSFIPGLGLDTTRLWTAAAPLIQQTDQYTNQLLRDTWSQLYDQTLASVNGIPTAGPIASALLTLLKYNWTTTYQAPGSSTPVVTTTKSLMNVPTPIDVDHDGLFDLCGTTSFALTGSGTSISGIKFTQSITKMPLAKAVLPVQIGGGLLNVLNFGYDTRESTAPVIYTTAATLDASTGGGLSIDNTYAVHRGTNLTIPPLTLQTLNTTGGLPTLLPLTEPAPKPIVTQEICIGACSTLAIRDRFENVPATTHVDGPLASAGTKINYTAPSTSDSYSHALAVGTSITLGTSAGRDRPATETGGPTTDSAPTSFQSCMSITDGSCSPNAASTDKASLSFTSSSKTLAEDNLAVGGAASNTCAGVTALGATAHFTGTRLNTSVTPGATGLGSGRIAVDSGGLPVEGCMAGGTIVGLLGFPNTTLPSGFAATNRASTYHLIPNPVLTFLLSGIGIDSKSGAVTCPAGTASGYTATSPAGAVDLAPVLCFVPPVNTAVPTISGNAVVDATLTVNPGTWTPPAPNAPAFAKQWYRCNGGGTGCAPIPGATGDTYTLDYGSYPSEPTDFGHRFKVSVTGTNLDGTATATSALTPVVGLPPAPTIATAPVLGSNRHVGDPLTTTNGTYNNGATSFTYQWQRCNDAAGASCADIAGATSSSYVLQTGDKGKYVRVGIVAKNHGGLAPINYSATALVPGDPANTVAPGIKNGPTSAIGAPVATGDNLSASAGTWTDTNAPFTFQWQLCDAGGGSCQDIAGATSATYQVTHPTDDGGTLRVAVTGHGLNGTGVAYSGTTGVVLFNDLSAKPVTQIPDGTVNATVAGAGTTTYIGGAFDTVGAPTGGSGLISDTGTGATVSLPSATAGAANGGVNATVPDGAGGYYLGGSFTQVRGVQCPGLAHLLSDGSVDQNYCYADLVGTVRALSRVNGPSKVLIVGGDFTTGGHQNLMFVDPATPAAPLYTAAGDPNGGVRSITVNTSSNNTIWIGGTFSQVGGTPAGLLASETLTWTSGALSSAARNSWSVGVCIGATGSTGACTAAGASVNSVAWLQGTLSGLVIVGGRFDTEYRNVSGTPANVATRNNALLVQDTNATVLGTAGPSLYGWNPNINGGNQTVNAIQVGPTSGLSNVPIYIGGDFDKIGSASIKNLGEFSATLLGASGASNGNNNGAPMTSWLPNPNGPVNSLAWAGSSSSASLIVGGGFTTIDTRLNTSTPFTTVVRHRLARVNLSGSTGSTLPVVDGTWDPNAGRTVRTVSRDTASGTVTVGGDFLVLGGTTRNGLAELDPNTGVTSWNPSADGPVNALAFRGGTVYVGGAFANAGGAARANLAAVDGASGAATGWNPGANGTVSALATDAGNVYVGGAFGTAGGSGRANLAAIDGGGSATGWNPGTDGAVNAIAVNGAGVYLGGAFTHLGPDARGHVALVDPSTGVVLAWNPGVSGTVNALFLFGSQVFVGGQYSTAGGAARSNLAALDAGSDSALSFKPDPNGPVRAISRTSGGSIAVGGAFTIISGQAAPGLGFYGG
jgi:hypothetical protein